MTVRFTQRQSPYQSGDVAGFAPDIESRFVASGVAVYYTKPTEAAKTAVVNPAAEPPRPRTPPRRRTKTG